MPRKGLCRNKRFDYSDKIYSGKAAKKGRAETLTYSYSSEIVS